MKYKQFSDAFMVHQNALHEFAMATQEIIKAVNANDFRAVNDARARQHDAQLDLTQLIMDVWSERQESKTSCNHDNAIPVGTDDPHWYCPECKQSIEFLPRKKGRPLHNKGCEIGDNWKQCPACVEATLEKR